MNAEVTEFLEALFDTYGFSEKVLYDDNDFGEWEREYWDDLCADWGCETHYGATKAVFELPELDYVIKVGFTHYKTDYCSLEVENFAKAMEAGLGNYFAETWELGTVNGITFFAQEKCQPNEDDIITSIRHTTGDDTMGGGTDDVQEWMSLIMDWEEYEKLRNFMRQTGINDVHSGNVALNDTEAGFIIFDYSGYFGDSESRYDEDRSYDETCTFISYFDTEYKD